MNAADRFDNARKLRSRTRGKLLGIGLLILVAALPWACLATASNPHFRENTLPVLLPVAGVLSLLHLVEIVFGRAAFSGAIEERTQLPIRTNNLAILLIDVSVFLGIFANVYWLLAEDDPTAFNEPLSRVDSTYFTITTFTTTGYGDIHPMTGVARSTATAQMVIGLLILSVVISVAVARAREKADAPRDAGARRTRARSRPNSR
jgi:voltage-gated potassium channel